MHILLLELRPTKSTLNQIKGIEKRGACRHGTFTAFERLFEASPSLHDWLLQLSGGGLWVSRGLPGASWELSGNFGAVFGSYGAVLGRCWCRPDWGHFGTLLGSSWVFLRGSCDPFEASSGIVRHLWLVCTGRSAI